jgi:hypothetical protein
MKKEIENRNAEVKFERSQKTQLEDVLLQERT